MKLKATLAIIALIAVTLLFPAQSFAGKKVKVVKHKPHKTVVVKKRHHAKPKVMVKLPVHHKKILVKGNPYYVHAGVWYKHGPSGYTVIKAPHGARLKVLPNGYRKVVFGGVIYFNYYGTYYRHDPVVKEYYVVDTPPSAVTQDVVTLYDGDELKGTYLGGDNDKIEFQVGEEVYEVEVSDIVSIHFEPPDDE